MPTRRREHPNCRLEPLAAALRGEILRSLRRLRTAIHDAERVGDETSADAFRIDLLSIDELLGRVDVLERRHMSERSAESRDQATLAEIRRAHQALVGGSPGAA